MGGLISGGETVAVPVQEELDGERVATATLLATKAGVWGLGVYVQIDDTRYPPPRAPRPRPRIDQRPRRW